MKCLDPVCELRDQHIGQATLGCHMIEQGVIGKAAHHSHVTLLSMYNDEWALIRSAAGEE